MRVEAMTHIESREPLIERIKSDLARLLSNTRPISEALLVLLVVGVMAYAFWGVSDVYYNEERLFWGGDSGE